MVKLMRKICGSGKKVSDLSFHPLCGGTLDHLPRNHYQICHPTSSRHRHLLLLVAILIPMVVYLFVLRPVFVRAATHISDDFNQNNLGSQWAFVDPLGDGQVAIVEVGGDAHLEISVPAAISHNPYHTNRATRVMQAADNTDMSVVVKFDSVPATNIQIQGLFFEQDTDNWLRFDNHYQSSKNRFYAATTESGITYTEVYTQYDLTGSMVYLQVVRVSDTYTYSFSENGSAWTTLVSFTSTFTINKIGIFASNHPDTTAPQYTARVDYFEVDSDPISSEDGSVPTDTQAPLIHTLRQEGTSGKLTVRWYTDEPAHGFVEYGPDTSYGTTQAEGAGLVYEHSLTLQGLEAGQTHHYRIRSEDAGARSANSADFEISFPLIDLWYGIEQHFGALGQTQPWINLLGNVTDTVALDAFTYSLNGAAPVDLSTGPDSRRLEKSGDFNVDIATNDLLSGANEVVIRAKNNDNFSSQVTATVYYTANTLWPSPYTLDWSTLSDDADIQNVAQVVDGKWKLDAGGLRIDETGYDRLLAFGDRTWTDYEVTVPITMYSMGWNAGVGLIFRWDGHTDDPIVCNQPHCGWLPLGELAWIRDDSLDFFIAETSVARTWELGTQYLMKMRVETAGDASTYLVKVWDAAELEPSGWDLTHTPTTTLSAGSVVLLTHRTDVTFGDVYVERIYKIFFPLIAK